MSSMPGCFSPYMLISSTLQSVFGYDRRKEQDKQADIAQQHQLELRKAREEFQDELEAQKVAAANKAEEKRVAKEAVAYNNKISKTYIAKVVREENDKLKLWKSCIF